MGAPPCAQTRERRPPYPLAACSSLAMSSFCILSMACIVRLALALSGSLEQLGQGGRHDLPGEAVLVLQPAALRELAAFAQLLPVVVDLVLRFAGDLERYRLVELELRPAVEGHELQPHDLEGGGDHRAGLAGACLAIARDAAHLGSLEDGRVVPGGLLGLTVEPQERYKLLHLPTPSAQCWGSLATRRAGRRRDAPPAFAYPAAVFGFRLGPTA